MDAIRMLIRKHTRFARGRLPVDKKLVEEGVVVCLDAISLAALLSTATQKVVTVEEVSAYLQQIADPENPERIIDPSELAPEKS